MAESDATPSDVPDVLAPDLRIVFVGINPGRVSAAARAHFANPRNDFWRLLHATHLTSVSSSRLSSSTPAASPNGPALTWPR
jgi:G:T/U-mismatch repair DNA glycosylase